MDIPKKLVKDIKRRIRDKQISVNLEITLSKMDKRKGNVILRKGKKVNIYV